MTTYDSCEKKNHNIEVILVDPRPDPTTTTTTTTTLKIHPRRLSLDPLSAPGSPRMHRG